MIPSIDALRDAARIVLTVAAIALLTACGGGGGGFSGSTPASKYIKAFNTEQSADCEPVPDPDPATKVGCDQFGSEVALNAEGDLLVVGAPFEDSNSTDVTDGAIGSPANNAIYDAGAVYTYVRDGDSWVIGQYIKATNTGSLDQFGEILALSDDGDTLAVGVPEEDSNATGVNGDQANNNRRASGAVYIFVRDLAGDWSQEAYIKSAVGIVEGFFGSAVALSEDGNALAVGAPGEERVYVYRRSGVVWNATPDVLQASNTELGDNFGSAVALSDDGLLLAAGAPQESSDGSGEANNGAANAGAVYAYLDSGASWAQQSYIKSSQVAANSEFGNEVSLDAIGDKLAVGARFENGGATDAGAAYIYTLSGGVPSDEQRVIADDRRAGDKFGSKVALTADGSLLFVTASLEDGSGENLDGDPNDRYNDTDLLQPFNNADAGAAYSFDTTSGVQQSYIKALNTGQGDKFGESLAVDATGSRYAIGATLEDSPARGVDPANQDNVSELQAGAAYLFQ